MKLQYRYLVAPLLVVTALAQPVRADDDHRIDDAWKAAVAESEGILTPVQTAALNTLAYESAVARLCDGFKLDEAKYGTSVGKLVAEKDSKLTEEEQMQRLSSVLFSLGTAHGIFLAEGAAKKDDFCAKAAEVKADKEHSHSWE